ncbi:MAG TPA: GYF domain-containing protein [Opitutaceae bacterium]|jgi:hypothetical protein|nr:GYF domain-containing protein [Opitutaceae bacterium]
MYTIIGGDGKEYGPVTAAQIRSWIAGGRANLETKVKEAGSDTWQTVADFQDIIGPSSAAAVPMGDPGIFQEVAKLDIISCYERSWALLKANFWPLVGASVLMSIFYGFLIYLQQRGILFVSLIFGGALAGGLYYYFLRKVRGQATTIRDLFFGFTKPFMSLLVAGILVAILITVGIFCLVLPGIYLIVSYVFTQMLIVDRGLGFWEAMEASRKVVTKQWWRILGLVLLSVPFMLVGIAAFVVGIFIALPLITGAVVYAYEDLCNPSRKTETPVAPTA